MSDIKKAITDKNLGSLLNLPEEKPEPLTYPTYGADGYNYRNTDWLGYPNHAGTKSSGAKRSASSVASLNKNADGQRGSKVKFKVEKMQGVTCGIAKTEEVERLLSEILTGIVNSCEYRGLYLNKHEKEGVRDYVREWIASGVFEVMSGARDIPLYEDGFDEVDV